MARISAFKVTIDTLEVDGLADRLSRLDSEAIGRASLSAVNTVTEEVMVESQAKMVEEHNLTPAYIEERMALIPASDPSKPVASVLARYRNTTLGRYGGRQLTQVVRYPNETIPVGKMGMNPRKPGSPLPWKARIGDASRGIPVGMKQAGISVEVKRGSRKPISYAFVIPTAGGMLTVKRKPGTSGKGRGDLEAMYGPSVYQLFRGVLNGDYLEEIEGRLSETVIEFAENEIDKVLG